MKPSNYTRAQALPGILAQRIAILDGAMGTMIQRFKLGEAQYRGEGYTGPGSQGDRFKDFSHDVKGNNELLSITRPDVIRDIHERYLAAGADLIETNTFGATSVAQADYGMEDLAVEMNLASARLARAACDKFSTPDKPRFVCGALGPTPKTASISPDVNDPGARNVTFEELRKAYYDQTKALVEGGADVILVETIFDTLNAKAALFAVDEYFEASGERLPIIISGTVKGPVHANLMLELQPKARIEGDVHYRALEMHQGATISGQMVPMLPGDVKPTLVLAANNK